MRCFFSSLVPRLSPFFFFFFVLWLAFSTIHRSRRSWKMGKAWEHLPHEWRLVDASGRKGGLAHLTPHVQWTIERVSYRWSQSCEHLTWDPGYRWSARWWSLVRYLNVDPPGPPHVHLAFTRRHPCDRCSQVFPVFRALSLLCIILNANQRANTGEPW